MTLEPSCLQSTVPRYSIQAIIMQARPLRARSASSTATDSFIRAYAVRHGHCIAAFWPDVVGIPRQERHLQYEWNGQTVTRYFDYSLSEWFPIPMAS